MIYYNLARSFGKTPDRMGRDTGEDGNERRRHITLHSDLGYADYSEYLYGIPGLLIGAKKIQKKQSYSVKLNLI